MRYVLLALVAACYSPGYRDCEITCGNGSCPAGFSCENGVCRASGFSGPCGQMNGDGSGSGSADAMIDGNMNLDSDGDGKNDAVDNCRMIANPDQADEDMDNLGDVCDPCPPYRINPADNSDANLDSDGDGVGNGCDPNPTAFGEKLLLFEPFNVQMSGSTSGPASTQIIVGNGMAQINAPTASDWGAVTFSLMTDLSKLQYVTTAVHENQVFPSSMPVTGGGPIAYYDGIGRGAGCVFGVGMNMTHALMLSDINPNSPQFMGQVPVPAAVMDLAVRNRRRGNEFECSSQPSFGRTMAPLNTSIANPSRFGVYARSADMQFQWVMVVEGS